MNNIMEAWQGRTVEGLYLPVAMVAVAVRTSLIDPRSYAITNAIQDWLDRKAELESEGESITCMCCKKPLTGKTIVGGFVIMIPVEVGGFDAATKVDCLVGSVCAECDTELESNDAKIMEKAMPGGAVHMAPGSEKVQ